MPIIDTTLPVHPLTGLEAIGVLPSGRPVWPVLGGSGDADAGSDAEKDDSADEDAEAEDQRSKAADSDGKGDSEKSGDADGDEKDWQAEFEAQKKVNRSLERRTRKDLSRIKQLESELAELREPEKEAPREGAKQDDKDGKADTTDPEEIRRRIEAELKAEAAKERAVDKIEVRAAQKFADPADAVAIVLRNHTIDDFLDEGKPDLEAIEDALNELLEKKPYLAAQGGKRFKGSGDGGSKPNKPQRPRSLNEAVSKALTPNT